MIEFKLPDIGEGIAEGEIVKWLVSEGDAVEEHQPIVEVMTDKATVEIPAPAKGLVKKLRAAEGDTVPVGSVIFELEAGEAASTSASAARPSKEAAAKPDRERSQEPEPEERPEREERSEPEERSEKERKPAPTSEPRSARERKPEPAAAERKPAAARGDRTLDFKLPDIGEGIAEGEVVKWLVAEGETVEEHQAVVEVMTDKATVEIPAPSAGRVVSFRAAEGETVAVGAVLFRLETQAAGEAQEDEPQEAEESREEVESEDGEEPQEVEAAEEEPQSAEAPAAAARSRTRSNGKVLAVPSARRVARELGIDLSQVPGSGRGGVVRRKDVEAFAAGDLAARGASPAPRAPAKPAAAPARPQPSRPKAGGQAAGDEQRRPFRGVRRKIADAMVRSKFTAPHFTVVEEVDVTELVALREKAKAIGAEQGVKVTYMPFIMKATALGLARHPTLNGHLDEEAQEIVNPSWVNLGIAIDTQNGLIVPVLSGVESKGMLQLAAELGDLGERTRAGKVRPEELRGSTFTITNAGGLGGTLATPIINFPDIAILGVHRIVKRPGVVETAEGERIEVRQYMNFSCSVDHRLADGADAARFLAYLRTLLESPGLLGL